MLFSLLDSFEENDLHDNRNHCLTQNDFDILEDFLPRQLKCYVGQET